MGAAEHEDAERAVKKRVMGTMRLISELYKKDMVRDWIITTCLESLLSKEKGKNTAHEDSVEVRRRKWQAGGWLKSGRVRLALGWYRPNSRISGLRRMIA